MIIRDEMGKDWSAVQAVNDAAFDTAAEGCLVAALRARAQPIVSMVAEIDGAIVGHILFSPVRLDDSPELVVMGLGPMAVLPGHQRQGIGSALVEAGLESCRELDIGAVVVLGHPEYYPRFGFAPAAEFGINCTYEVPAEVFMVLELQPGYLDGVGGIVRYDPAFDGV